MSCGSGFAAESEAGGSMSSLQVAWAANFGSHVVTGVGFKFMSAYRHELYNLHMTLLHPSLFTNWCFGVNWGKK